MRVNIGSFGICVCFIAFEFRKQGITVFDIATLDDLSELSIIAPDAAAFWAQIHRLSFIGLKFEQLTVARTALLL